MTNPQPDDVAARVAAVFDAEIAELEAEWETSARIEWLEGVRDRVLTEIRKPDASPGPR